MNLLAHDRADILRALSAPPVPHGTSLEGEEQARACRQRLRRQLAVSLEPQLELVREPSIATVLAGLVEDSVHDRQPAGLTCSKQNHVYPSFVMRMIWA